MKIISVCFLSICLWACAARNPAPVVYEPAVVWEEMAKAPAITGPERTLTSMRFGSEGDTRRVTAVLWGNDARSLRLDVMAGAGVSVAKIYDGPGEFLIYIPGENRAYIHRGENKPLLRVGTPLPFNLGRLADLLSGRYAAAFGAGYSDARLADRKAIFTLADGSELTVDGRGLPVAWRQSGRGWSLAITYGEDELPESLSFSNSDGRRAIILVKERERLSEPFAPEQTTLKLPPGATLEPLARFKASRI